MTGDKRREATAPDLAKFNRYESALRTIRGPADCGPWVDVYRAAGGGYEGLQAIAESALTDAAASAPKDPPR